MIIFIRYLKLYNCLQIIRVRLDYLNSSVQLAGAVEYTDCISAEGLVPAASILDMTLNYI